MQYMNSSPVMTMILQPEFSPAPRQPNAYMVMAPSTPPPVYGSFRRKDKCKFCAVCDKHHLQYIVAYKSGLNLRKKVGKFICA